MAGGMTGVVMLECLVLVDGGQQTGGAGERMKQRVAVVALLLLLGVMGDLVTGKGRPGRNKGRRAAGGACRWQIVLACSVEEGDCRR